MEDCLNHEWFRMNEEVLKKIVVFKERNGRKRNSSVANRSKISIENSQKVDTPSKKS